MDRRAAADRVIRSHVLWALGAGLVPIPFVDIAAVTMIQLDMMQQLATIYGIPYNETQGKSFVTAITGSVAARIGASAIKTLPGIGSLIGGVSMSILSGASTYAVGQVVKGRFEAGKDFSGIDMDDARRAYEQEYEKGKKVAEDLSKEKDASKEVFEKLEKLGELRDKGVISAEEFEAKKKELLGRL